MFPSIVGFFSLIDEIQSDLIECIFSVRLLIVHDVVHLVDYSRDFVI